jgi:hypothetical protein
MSTPNRWRIGQKVLCIDDSFPRYIADWCNALPVAGNVYTIRGMQFGLDPITYMYDLGLLLEEISSPRKADGTESGFFHSRFVPWLDKMAESAAAQDELAEGVSASMRRNETSMVPSALESARLTFGRGLGKLADRIEANAAQ